MDILLIEPPPTSNFGNMCQFGSIGTYKADIAYYILLHALSFVDDGLIYRCPIQPFLCIFAAYGYLEIIKIYFPIRQWLL